ncbi:alkaline phosphatase [Desulfovibrio psychrotolerans]|uniref:Alkaline phosphatase n=1 Tax=Desulfovibrio psychrotolerans TaxID=415242 RepID=A0A7J0BRR0_9BACT|nr:alkaline phosphatase [Desulfovibrio psychrotolerans]GFM36397.1 alkaline phosphatase [Desulfovibrio psychrotolerans]
MVTCSRHTKTGFAVRMLLALAICLFLAQPARAGKAKYVFLFIVDGMSMSQIYVAESYKAILEGKEVRPGAARLAFTHFPHQAMTTTYSSESLVTDSAAAGTAIATGTKTYNAGVGVDADGKPVPSVAEMARDKGMKVGIVTSVSLDHATPAAFYAHQKSRKNHYEIGLELAASNFHYFAGGGFVDPEGKQSRRKGRKEHVLDAIRSAGYSYVNDKASFAALGAGARAVVVPPRLQDEQSMFYAIDAAAGDISLADLTAKGIEVLDNPNGFFMMVESGKVDWACHANDAATVVNDLLALEAAVERVLGFAAKHPEETLIVVTGDHETGGMALGFAGTRYSTYLQQLARQKGSHSAFNKMFTAWRKANPHGTFEQVAPMIDDFFGLRVSASRESANADTAAGTGAESGNTGSVTTQSIQPFEEEALRVAFARSMSVQDADTKGPDYLLYGWHEPFTVALTHLLNKMAGVSWTSYSHTGVPVLTFATGVESSLFQGYYDNTDLFTKFVAVLGLPPRKALN